MRSKIWSFALGFFALTMGLPSAPVWADDYQLAHVFAASNANHKGALKWAELVDKYTNGKVKISVFPAGQLGGDREIGQALEMGTMGFSVHNPGAASNDVKIGIASLPFLTPSYEEVDRLILRGWVGEQSAKYCLDHGWRVLAWGENDFRQLTNSKRPVKSVDDIKGLKLRVPQSPVMLAIWKALGAIPTPIAFPELYTALQQGTVDGQENGILLTYSSRLHEVQKYVTLIGYMYSGTGFEVGEKTWKKFDKPTQDAIQKAAVEAAAFQVKQNRDDVNEARAGMEKAGVQFVQMPAEELAKLRKIAIESSWGIVQKEVEPAVWERLMKEVQK